MSIPDVLHQQDQEEATRLRELGFALEVTADGYFVRFNGQGIGGASVQLPRERPLSAAHRVANIRDNLAAAIRTAKVSQFYTSAPSLSAPRAAGKSGYRA